MDLRLLTIVIAPALVFFACSGKRQEERRAERPAEVAGGFGLTMKCSVLNRDNESAVSSTIGCVVSNDDGSAYKGNISGTTAEIVTSSGKVIKVGKIENSTDDGTYTFGAEVDDLKPGEAATIRVTANFDEGVRTLVASLKGNFTTTCYEDLEFFVDSKALESNSLCKQDAKCSLISKAIKLLPDIINCNIKISVAEGQYTERIAIDAVQISRGKSITIDGARSPAPPKYLPATKILLDFNIKNQSSPGDLLTGAGLSTANAGINSAVLKLQNLVLDCDKKPDSTAVRLLSSSTELSNVVIDNCTVGVDALDGSTIRTKDVSLSVARVGISVNQTELFARGDLTINRNNSEPIDSVGLWLLNFSKFRANVIPDCANLYKDKPDLIPSCQHYKLQIKGFKTGIKGASGSSYRSLYSDKISITDVEVGLQLSGDSDFGFGKPLSSLDFGNEAAELFIRDYTRNGIELFESSEFQDYALFTTDVPEKRPRLKVQRKNVSLPDDGLTFFMNSDDSKVALLNSALCFAASQWTTVGEVKNYQGFYAFRSFNGSKMDLAWDVNPLAKDCFTDNVLAVDDKIPRHVMTFDDTFPSTALSCPSNYLKLKTSSDTNSLTLCYSGLGYFTYRPYGLLWPTSRLGVVPAETRVDNLKKP